MWTSMQRIFPTFLEVSIVCFVSNIVLFTCELFLNVRKVCANCLCPREEHDIRTQEERQHVVGKLLFYSDSEQMVKGASPKRFVKNLLFNSIESCSC